MSATIFANGFRSLLEAKWAVRLETPLCIKSGAKSAFTPTGMGNKTRLTRMGFDWHAEKGQRNEVVETADLHAGIRVVKDRVEAVYTIPASSFRGALRTWTLQRLVKEDDNRNILNTADDGESDVSRLAAALRRDADTFDPGLGLVADVFGVSAGEKESEAVGLSHAGRMRIEVSDLQDSAPAPWVQGEEWKPEGNRFGPSNAPRHISVRGPVDRITQGARMGGLHYFLEFSPGLTFTVVLRVVNPIPAHLDLLRLWRRELDAGALRLGGLTSVGRGRLSVNDAGYHLVTLPGNEWHGMVDPAEEIDSGDVFHGIWKRYPLSKPQKDFASLRNLLYESPVEKQEKPSCTT